MLVPLALVNFSVMRLSMLLSVNTVLLSMLRTASLKVMVDYWPEVVVDNQTKSLELPYMEEFQVVLTASLLEESPIFLIINGEEIVQCLA